MLFIIKQLCADLLIFLSLRSVERELVQKPALSPQLTAA